MHESFCLLFSVTRTPHLLRSRTSTPNSVPDSPRSLDSRINMRSRPSLANNSALRLPRGSNVTSAGYDSDDSIKFERSNHIAMAQDVMSIKTMLLKLKRVLYEVCAFASIGLFVLIVCAFYVAFSLFYFFLFIYLHGVVLLQQTDEEFLLRVSIHSFSFFCFNKHSYH